MAENPLPRAVYALGLAGWLPAFGCAAGAVFFPAARTLWLEAGLVYVALIFSFLGGLWWMAALLSGRREVGVYLLAVAPSLLAWATLVLSLLPGGAKAGSWWLAVGLLLSPLVDGRLGRTVPWPDGWRQLRLTLSIGLSLATVLLAAME